MFDPLNQYDSARVHFCTYFDENYLLRGLTLYRSVRRSMPAAQFWILCFDDASLHAVRRLGLPGVHIVSTKDIERFEPALLNVRGSRSAVEYFFTCTPVWCRYVLDQAAPGEIVTYLDADLYFFRSPREALAELGSDSILIVPHRFPPGSLLERRAGKFNVGLVSFRNDPIAVACLTWWAAQCIAWCSDVPDMERYADQKYLDDWPLRFERVAISRDVGAGLAPWNWMQYHIAVSNHAGPASIDVDRRPLIYFHFHNLTILSSRLYDSGTAEYGPVDPIAEQAIYWPYLSELRATQRLLLDYGIQCAMRDRIFTRRRRNLGAIIRKVLRMRLARRPPQTATTP